ncbi:pyridoxine/pyridoxamine 5'-phosphate oxidase isoform X2 [Lasioglossum baleicum]|uniref:pyridoxine/pyridoxamine 5'-phosphate oxidase isoform X2 n=1 Tax=Lasioglossum baleicum TaxID=434251 RepID=UPI003FCD7E67
MSSAKPAAQNTNFNIDIGGIRIKYKDKSETFTEDQLVSKEPIGQFKAWFQEACKTPQIFEPNAMFLATATKNGMPSVRAVLLKGLSADGFKFYTNYESRKGRELAKAGMHTWTIWEQEQSTLLGWLPGEVESAPEWSDYNNVDAAPLSHAFVVPKRYFTILRATERVRCIQNGRDRASDQSIAMVGIGGVEAENPNAALSFYWEPLKRVVRVEGRVEKTSAEDSDRYFQSRPYSNQIGSIASKQSAVIASRQTLVVRERELLAQFPEGHVKRPACWGGYIVIPHSVEFWQGQSDRLHDRIRFRRPKPNERIDNVLVSQGDDGWVYERLSP